MKITIETTVNANLPAVWAAWNRPEDIVHWNAASDDWHTTRSTVDLRVGGQMTSRMEAKDGSMGFDFGGTFTEVIPHTCVGYTMSDGRTVRATFAEVPGGVRVVQTFDAEDENPAEMQRSGWQAILDSFRRYVERKS